MKATGCRTMFCPAQAFVALPVVCIRHSDWSAWKRPSRPLSSIFHSLKQPTVPTTWTLGHQGAATDRKLLGEPDISRETPEELGNWMERQRGVFLIFLILFFFFSPDTTQPPRSQQKQREDGVLKKHQALARLRHSSYGHFPPTQDRQDNATSSVEQESQFWSLLPKARQRARAQYLELFIDTDKVSKDDVIRGDEAVYDSVSKTAVPFYQNVSGMVQGNFVTQSYGGKIQSSTNLTTIAPHHDYFTHHFWRNVTEAEGSISLQMLEIDDEGTRHDTTREITADVTIRTESSPGNGWEMRMFGLHYLKSGSIILTTTSDKFPGIFTLPHFALTSAAFEQSKALLNQSLTATIMHQEKNDSDEPSFPWSSTSAGDSTSIFGAQSCEYVVFLQQKPVHFRNLNLSPPRLVQLITQVEKELRFPTGAPLPPVPPMVFSAVVFSPNCGFFLESNSDRVRQDSHIITGPKTEVFWGLIRKLLVALLITLGLQITLLKRQMDEASTPSMRSRTSYHTIAIMAMGDGLMLASIIAFSMLNDVGFLILTAAGFLCFFNFAFFEMKFIYDIWLVQVGHQRREERERRDPPNAEEQIRVVTPPSHQNPPTATGLPLPASAPRSVDTGATPIILPPDQDIEAAADEDEQQAAAVTGSNPAPQRRGDFQTLYSKFYFTMLLLVFFSLWAFSWPKPIQSAYVNSLCFAYLSFWTPQIYRNIMRNCRQAFTREYIIGISVLRLLPVVYCYTKSSNVLRIQNDPLAAAIFVAWVCLQVLALTIQQFLGPRLFVKESWCPAAYDYHPLLQSDDGDIESGSLLPIGFVASASEAKDKDVTKDKPSNSNIKIFDCAICMNEIEVPVVPSKHKSEGSNIGTSWLSRRTYMVTPCRHVFHTDCLEGWMRLRLVCPICRESLPPL